MLNDRFTWLKVDFHIVQYNLNRAGHFLSESSPVVLYFSSATKWKKTCNKYSCFRYLKWYHYRPTDYGDRFFPEGCFIWNISSHILRRSGSKIDISFSLTASGINCFFLLKQVVLLMTTIKHVKMYFTKKQMLDIVSPECTEKVTKKTT